MSRSISLLVEFAPLAQEPKSRSLEPSVADGAGCHTPILRKCQGRRRWQWRGEHQGVVIVVWNVGQDLDGLVARDARDRIAPAEAKGTRARGDSQGCAPWNA